MRKTYEEWAADARTQLKRRRVPATAVRRGEMFEAYKAGETPAYFAQTAKERHEAFADYVAADRAYGGSGLDERALEGSIAAAWGW